MMLFSSSTNQVSLQFPSNWQKQIWSIRVDHFSRFKLLKYSVSSRQKVRRISPVNATNCPNDISGTGSYEKVPFLGYLASTSYRASLKKPSIWQISGLPNEKEVVYGALDGWIAWEAEFPLIAAAKALRILRKKNQWVRVIQVAKWMLRKGQGATYDSLLLAFDMDCRADEAEMLWDMILRTHTRSTSKKLFSKMISLYDHHNMPDKVIEVFADMEELGVKPDEDSVRKIAQAFENLGQADKRKLVLHKYQGKWKYIHFNGERVKVRRDPLR